MHGWTLRCVYEGRGLKKNKDKKARRHKEGSALLSRTVMFPLVLSRGARERLVFRGARRGAPPAARASTSAAASPEPPPPPPEPPPKADCASITA